MKYKDKKHVSAIDHNHCTVAPSESSYLCSERERKPSAQSEILLKLLPGELQGISSRSVAGGLDALLGSVDPSSKSAAF